MKVILFDLGGVLHDWVGDRGLVELTRGAIDAERARRFWLESTSVQKFGRGLCSAPEFGAGVVSELGLMISPEEFVRAFVSWDRGPMRGAQTLIGSLSQKYELACLSNNNELHWNRVEKAGFHKYFDHLYISHLTGLVKPAVEAFTHVVSDLDYPASEILFFDDNQECIDSAKSIGMNGFRVNGVDDVKRTLSRLRIDY